MPDLLGYRLPATRAFIGQPLNLPAQMAHAWVFDFVDPVAHAHQPLVARKQRLDIVTCVFGRTDLQERLHSLLVRSAV